MPLTRTFLLIGSIILLRLSSVWGHDLNTSYTNLEIDKKSVHCILSFDLTDLNRLFVLDQNGDGQVSKVEFRKSMDSMSAFLEQNFAIYAGGRKIQLKQQQVQFDRPDSVNVFVHFAFTGELQDIPWKMMLKLDFLHEFGNRHQNLARIVNGSEIQQAVFTADFPTQTLSFAGEEVSVWSHFTQFLRLGVEHIFFGYDHILFLLGLIVIGGGFRDLIKIVTSFTGAHSITLALAALGIISLPGRLVESVIALSIAYVALENFMIKDTDQRWMIAFVFGLMHGFGFANVLRELGLPAKGLAASLFSFNLGVEMGQIAIVAILFPVIFFLTQTRWRKQFVYGFSSIIFILGMVWFIERAFHLNFH